MGFRASKADIDRYDTMATTSVGVNMSALLGESPDPTTSRRIDSFASRSLGESAASIITLWCRHAGHPEPKPEYRFAEDIGRRWRFDLAWPEQKIAVEFEGGIRNDEGRGAEGHHVSVDGYESDCEKYNTAAVLYGYRVIRVTYAMHRRGDTVRFLEKAFSISG